MSNETQDDRCSDQSHLWRQRNTFGFIHMACRCGAVHPNDLDQFLAAPFARSSGGTR